MVFVENCLDFLKHSLIVSYCISLNYRREILYSSNFSCEYCGGLNEKYPPPSIIHIFEHLVSSPWHCLWRFWKPCWRRSVTESRLRRFIASPTCSFLPRLPAYSWWRDTFASCIFIQMWSLSLLLWSLTCCHPPWHQPFSLWNWKQQKTLLQVTCSCHSIRQKKKKKK